MLALKYVLVFIKKLNICSFSWNYVFVWWILPDMNYSQVNFFFCLFVMYVSVFIKIIHLLFPLLKLYLFSEKFWCRQNEIHNCRLVIFDKHWLFSTQHFFFFVVRWQSNLCFHACCFIRCLLLSGVIILSRGILPSAPQFLHLSH